MLKVSVTWEREGGRRRRGERTLTYGDLTRFAPGPNPSSVPALPPSGTYAKNPAPSLPGTLEGPPPSFECEFVGRSTIALLWTGELSLPDSRDEASAKTSSAEKSPPPPPVGFLSGGRRDEDVEASSRNWCRPAEEVGIQGGS